MGNDYRDFNEYEKNRMREKKKRYKKALKKIISVCNSGTDKHAIPKVKEIAEKALEDEK